MSVLITEETVGHFPQTISTLMYPLSIAELIVDISTFSPAPGGLGDHCGGGGGGGVLIDGVGPSGGNSRHGEGYGGGGGGGGYCSGPTGELGYPGVIILTLQ